MTAVDGRPEEATQELLGGEPSWSLRARAGSAFAKLVNTARETPGRRCLVVMHGKFLKELLTNVIRASGDPSYQSAALCMLEHRDSIVSLSRALNPMVFDRHEEEARIKIYLVRHGQAEDDLDDSYGGAADHRLTPKGEEQAHEIAKALRDLGIKRIYTSPLRRALVTAEIVSRELGLSDSVHVADDLRERNSYGVLSGIPKQKAWDLFPLLLKAGEKRSGHSKTSLLGAEEYDAFATRVGAMFDQVVADATERKLDRIAVVTHGTFLWVLLTDKLGLSFPDDWKHGSSMLLDYEEAKATVSPL